MFKKGLCFLIFCLGLASVVYGIEFLGTYPGDAGDNLDTTFCFDESNATIQLKTSDGANFGNSVLSLAYGKHIGIFVNNRDIVEERDLEIIGIDLTTANNYWTNASFPPNGAVAIDTQTGRFKFSSQLDWKTPKAISDIINNPQNLRISMNNNGEALAVYTESDGTATRLYAMRYVPGMGWEKQGTIDSGNGGSIYEPCVEMNDSGAGIVAFAQVNTVTVRKEIFVRRFLGHTNWSLLESVGTTNTANHMNNIDLGFNNNGHAIVTFTQIWYSAKPEVHANVFMNGSGWQGWQIVDAGGGSGALSPKVALNDNNRAVCVYKEFNTPITLYANSCTLGSTWEGISPMLDANTGSNVDECHVGIDGYDNIVVLFSQNYSGIRLYSSVYRNGSWDVPTQDQWIDNGAPVRQNNISLAMSNSVAAICTFTNHSSSTTFAKHYSSQTGIWRTQSTGQLNIKATNSVVAINTTGDGYAVYRDANYPGNLLEMKNYDQSTDVWRSTEITLSSNSPAAYTMAMNNNKEIITIYSEDGKLFSCGWLRDVPLEMVSVYYHTAGDEEGTLTVTPTIESSEALSNYNLKGKTALAYPNPAQNEVHFLMHLQEKAMITFKVFNLKGEQVGAVHKLLEPGDGQVVTWDCVDVAPGLYITKVFLNGLEKEAIKIAIVK